MLAAYMILAGDLEAVMDTIRSIQLMKGTRIVIEPLSEHLVEIGPDV